MHANLSATFIRRAAPRPTYGASSRALPRAICAATASMIGHWDPLIHGLRPAAAIITGNYMLAVTTADYGLVWRL